MCALLVVVRVTTLVPRLKEFQTQSWVILPVAQGHWNMVQVAGSPCSQGRNDRATGTPRAGHFFSSFFLSSPGGSDLPWFEGAIECRLRDALAAGDSRKPVTEHRPGGQPAGDAPLLSDERRRWRLCFGIERMLTVRRDGVMV